MGVLLTGLSSPLFCVCVEPEPGFPAPYVVAFLCSVVLGERWLFVLILVELITITLNLLFIRGVGLEGGKLMRWPEK